MTSIRKPVPCFVTRALLACAMLLSSVLVLCPAAAQEAGESVAPATESPPPPPPDDTILADPVVSQAVDEGIVVDPAMYLGSIAVIAPTTALVVSGIRRWAVGVPYLEHTYIGVYVVAVASVLTLLSVLLEYMPWPNTPRDWTILLGKSALTALAAVGSREAVKVFQSTPKSMTAAVLLLGLFCFGGAGCKSAQQVHDSLTSMAISADNAIVDAHDAGLMSDKDFLEASRAMEVVDTSLVTARSVEPDSPQWKALIKLARQSIAVARAFLPQPPPPAPPTP